MKALTVVVCTYNGASRIPAVLEALQSQSVPKSIQWEVIVVDNKSTDSTRKIIQDYEANWHEGTSFRYVYEEKLGLAFARLRGIKEADSDLIGFLDDDNIPAPDWVISSYQFGQNHPNAGVYSSQIHPQFETLPPPYVVEISYLLTIVERGSTAFIYERRNPMLPPGAGIVVRRQAWRENVPDQPGLVCRLDGAMLASEDIEVIARIQNGGWEIWYNPDMHVYHQIPPQRFEKNYLITLVRRIGLARHHIRRMRIKFWQRPFMYPLYMINDIQKVVVHWIKHRNIIATDIAAACEMELLLSSIESPFYLWKQRIVDRSRRSS